MASGTKAAVAALISICAVSPAYALTVHTSPFLISPTNVIGFEGLAAPNAPTSYSENGIDVSYVGETQVGDAATGIWSTSQVSEGTRSWYPNGGGFGYTRLQFDTEVTAFQFAAGSGWPLRQGTPVDPHLQFRLLRGGSIVAKGSVGGVPPFAGFRAFGFSGLAFDEVHLQSLDSDGDFNEGGLDALTLDALAFGGPIGVIPEPASWAMMILGFGLVGLAARHRRRVSAPA